MTKYVRLDDLCDLLAKQVKALDDRELTQMITKKSKTLLSVNRQMANDYSMRLTCRK